MPASSKPIASISLDLDDKWTYMKTHGDARWSTYPSYLSIVIPRVLAFLKERGLTISFFIVGQDAAFERNHELLRSISEAGHEICNHSFHHEPWLHLYSREDIVREFEAAEVAIESATGKRPLGFRGPGFSVSPQVIDVLIARGYRYDASTLPTFLGPLARAYYFFTAKLDPEEKKKRSRLFGTFQDGLRPLRSHEWRTAAGALREIPVTTVPVIRTPFHLSYLIYLHGFSSVCASAYARLAFGACKLAGVNPSFLLHPLDFLSREEAPELGFFPGMSMSVNDKLTVADKSLSILTKQYRPVRMCDHAALSEAN